MLNVDLKQFWKDDELAHLDNCFNTMASQAALGIRMSEECVFEELGVPKLFNTKLSIEERLELNKRYNDKAERIVGKRLLPEVIPGSEYNFPKIRMIGEVFGGSYFTNDYSEWLMPSCSTPNELEKMLDRVEKLDLREFILPENWEREKKRIYEKTGINPYQIRIVRGPVTLATSIFGIENLIFLILDEPELAQRFSNVIGEVICGMTDIMDEEAGYEPGAAPAGYAFLDDNCYLLTDEMYKNFGLPILKKVFDKFCSNPKDHRYQHSDSAMGHLLPQLAKVNLTGCNFGPTVLVDQIRKYMPTTRIDGCIAPFTFMNNDEEAIIKEVRRDVDMARESRGLNISTAGSINNGSLLTSMRAVMFAIQNYGRF